MKTGYIAALLAVLSGTALAHQGVQNPAVLARMDGMSAMKKHLGVIGDTVKGKRSYDAGALQQAIAGLDYEAARAKDLFRAPEQDPKSESLPLIWQDYADFTARLDHMSELAKANAAPSQDDLRGVLVGFGKSCKSCHDLYRK
jgi:cytochrome c556